MDEKKTEEKSRGETTALESKNKTTGRAWRAEN